MNVACKSTLSNQLFNDFVKYLSTRSSVPKKGILLDACHFTVSQRKSILSQVNKRLPCYMIYFTGTVDCANRRIQKRASTKVASFNGQDIFGRTVPDSVINTMARLEKLPDKKEGFKEVYFVECE